jgi:hypothetical protein
MKPTSTPLPSREVFLIGDSHARAIRMAGAAAGFTVYGGVLDVGRDLLNDFHTVSNGDVLFSKPKVDQRYRQFLGRTDATRAADLKMPVFCTFGTNIHYLSHREYWTGLVFDDSDGGQFISAGVFEATVRAMIAGAITFYKDLIAMGLTVYSSLPPRRTEMANPCVFRATEDIVLAAIGETGTNVIDHRALSLDANGLLHDNFCSPDSADPIHGSAAFGALLLAQVGR